MINKILAVAFTLVLLSGCKGASNGSFQGWNSSMSRDEAQSWLSQNVGDTVYFDTDSSKIDESANTVLSKQADWFKNADHKFTLTLEGHCDSRGSREYNLALGERRANAAKKALVSLGVDAEKVSTISYGKEKPAVAGEGSDVWAKNRRAYTKLN